MFEGVDVNEEVEHAAEELDEGYNLGGQEGVREKASQE
jgi:hypothetical protein